MSDQAPIPTALTYRGIARIGYDHATKNMPVEGLAEKFETLRAIVEDKLDATPTISSPAYRAQEIAERLTHYLIGDKRVLDLFADLHELNARTEEAEAAEAAAYREADRRRPRVSELLDRAAEIMDQSNGLCRNLNFDREAGTLTPWQAIRDATIDGPWVYRYGGRVMYPGWGQQLERFADNYTVLALGQSLEGREDGYYFGLTRDRPGEVAWGNAPERTKEDAVAMLRAAADLARADEQDPPA